MMVDIPTILGLNLILCYALKEPTDRNFSQRVLLQTDPNSVSGVYVEGLIIILSLQKVRSETLSLCYS